MVVTVPIVLMMQVTIDDVTEVIAVGHGRMTTIRAMNMINRMSSAGVPSPAISRIRRIDFQPMFLNGTIRADMVQMPIMEVVHMVTVLDTCVAAAGAVGVVVLRVKGTAHSSSCSSLDSGKCKPRPSNSSA